jgi:hypothetical protein
MPLAAGGRGVGLVDHGKASAGVSSETSTRVRGELRRRQRRKAVVAKGSGERIFADVDGQRPVRLEAADAAAQLAIAASA